MRATSPTTKGHHRRTFENGKEEATSFEYRSRQVREGSCQLLAIPGALSRKEADTPVNRAPKEMGELLLINEEVDTLFKILGLAGIDTMMEWRQVWTADQRVQQELMTTMVANTATVMGELQNTRAQLEAMMLLQFETEQRSERHSDNAMQLMQSMLSTVVKGSKATVEKLPPWFLPSSELEFEPEAFASVHRGVWGSGTHVVVKRFLVDDSTEVDLSVSKFNALRNCVEAVPKSDVVSLLNALQKGTDYEKEQALIRCVCITSERNRWQTSRNETRVHTIEKWE
ncbi:hypothetical protein PI126_g8374 [Phytophthora idaei]|nr:hypothetical protein PI126_g8374 [Phytophthora idaei]